MSIENIDTPHDHNLESLKESFRERLHVILHKELGVENIENFVDELLGEIVQVNEDIVTEYVTNPAIQKEQLTDREHEDTAYAFFNLDQIDSILTSINDLKEEIDILK